MLGTYLSLKGFFWLFIIGVLLFIVITFVLIIAFFMSGFSVAWIPFVGWLLAIPEFLLGAAGIIFMIAVLILFIPAMVILIEAMVEAS